MIESNPVFIDGYSVYIEASLEGNILYTAMV
jgi:hypothetical protein